MYELLKKLCDTVGPSGFEQDVQRAILSEVEPYIDEWQVDALGNLIVKKNGTESSYPSLLIAAHTDEIGFVIKKIEDNGLLRFEQVGGFDNRILLAQPVKVKTETGNVNGVIGTISAHYVKWDDPKRVSSHRDLYIDVGAKDRQDAINMGIKPGQPASYGTELAPLGNEGQQRVFGKALDDRASCALMIKLFQQLSEDDSHGDIYGAFTVQEEVGLRGASTVAATVNPDYALAIDTTPTSDTGDVLMGKTRVLGEGPCVKIADKSMIAHPLMTRLLEQIAQTYDIPYQKEIFMGIGTDAGAIHTTGKGVTSGVISIPSRYTHAPIEVVDMTDLEHSLALTHQFVLALNELKGKTFLDT